MMILIIFAVLALITVFLWLNRAGPQPEHKEKYEEEHSLVYDDDPLKKREERENEIFENEC